MPASHRPEVDVLISGDFKPEVFCWPQVNQEDLSSFRSFCLYIDSRGRNHPRSFILADLESAAAALRCGIVTPMHLYKYTMLFFRSDDADQYTRTISWVTFPQGRVHLMQGVGLQPGLGILALAIQAHIYQVLVKSCLLVLHDHDLATITMQPDRPRPPALASISNDASLISIAAEASYRSPIGLDLKWLSTLLSAKLMDAEDHVLSLREDPTYFRSCMDEAYHHDPELLSPEHRCQNCLRPSKAKGTCSDVVWTLTINDIARDGCRTVEDLHDLHQRAVKLEQMQQQYAHKIVAEKPLPVDYYEQLLCFEAALRLAITIPLAHLRHRAPASPQLRPFFQYTSDGPCEPAIDWLRVDTAKDKIIDRLMYLLRHLWGEDECFVLGRMQVIDEIQRMINADLETQRLFSPYIARIVSDIATLQVCLDAVYDYHPWARGFIANQDKHFPVLLRERQRMQIRFDKFSTHLDADVVAKGMITKVDFTCPLGKCRSEENIKKMRRAEKNLDAFWHAVDENWKRNVGGIRGTYTHLLLQSRTIERTPLWTMRDKQPSPRATQNKEILHLMVDSSLLLACASASTGVQSGHAFTQRVMAKHKTRTTNTLELDESSSSKQHKQDDTEHVQEQTDKLIVSARAVKVFKVLFHSPFAETPAGEVPWSEFLYAMAAAGFSVRKMYGSAWLFNPEAFIARSIQFHEPHPGNKLPFYTARRYGRRLSRAFGWKLSSFELLGRK